MATIRLKKNFINKVVVTLFEKTTLSPVFYLFEFINKMTLDKTYCIPNDISNEIYRYNEFLIHDKTLPNPLAGELNLRAGSYEYNVYEQSNNTNLNPAGLKIVEEGLCYVEGTNNYYTEYPATVTRTVYE